MIAPPAGSSAPGPIDPVLVQRLVSEQFPQWSGLPVTPVQLDGWDNRTFRLGDRLSVRLPSHERYAAQVEKEHRWLPFLGPQLPLPIPTPLAKGVATEQFPHSWSVYSWLDGEPAETAVVDDLTTLAVDLAGFLNALMRIDTSDGPQPGPHNFHRGGSLTTYDQETRRALAAVIDFGTSGVGDPSCDTVIAWTLLRGSSRAAFRAALDVDPPTWARGRGWALWKALITIEGARDSDPRLAARARAVADEVIADHERTG